jgi:hypothetical protein
MLRHHNDDRARTACLKDRKNRDVRVDGVVITPFEAEMIGILAETPGALMEVAREPVTMREPTPYSSR